MACGNCRKKKIRCDGGNPCRHCTEQGLDDCQYERKHPKPSSGRIHKSKLEQILMLLDRRLDRLEHIIYDVARSLRIDEKGYGAKALRQALAQNLLLSLSDSDSDETSSQMSQEVVDDGASPKAATGPKQAREVRHNELYFGTQSFISIMSKTSINWMREQLGEDKKDLVAPMINLPFVFHEKHKDMTSKLFLTSHEGDRSPPINIKFPLPENLTAIYNLVRAFKDQCLITHMLCPGNTPESLLDQYYNSKTSKKRKLQTQQLMQLCMVILFCIQDALDKWDETLSPQSQEDLTNIGLDRTQLEELATLLMQVVIIYSKQLCMLGHGIETVQAFLMFVIYLTKCNISPEVVHMMLTITVRKVLDLGLNKIESYEDLNTPIAQSKILVWRTACYADMEICFRSGKSPHINYDDVSPELWLPDLMRDSKIRAVSVGYYDFFQLIFEVRLESYTRLFSARADLRSFALLKDNLDYLNSKMYHLSLQLPEDKRPLFYHEPGFREVHGVSTVAEDNRVAASLTFFVHSMIINRLPSMFAYPGVPEASLKIYKDLSLNSARTVIHMLKHVMHRKFGGGVPLWIIYYPVMAVLHLLAACMINPNSPEAHSDVLLLVETCQKNYNNYHRPEQIDDTKLDFALVMEVLVKVVIKIAILIFEIKTLHRIFEAFPGLLEMLDSTKKLFPQMYGNTDNFKAAMNFIFNAKSPFPSDRTGEASPSTAHSSNSQNAANSASPEFQERFAYANVDSEFGGTLLNGQMADIDLLLSGGAADQFPGYLFENGQQII